jgi:hypothetical protein
MFSITGSTLNVLELLGSEEQNGGLCDCFVRGETESKDKLTLGLGIRRWHAVKFLREFTNQKLLMGKSVFFL